MCGHNQHLGGPGVATSEANGLHRGNPSPDEVQPVGQLCQLVLLGVSQAEGHQMDAVGVPNEVVIHHVVGLIAREFPQAQITTGCNGRDHV